ncbi:MAG: tungstate ABC transporter substrate-binding protein WtpA [Ignavibacteriae bacterium HGW-Ignavibacteriae-3]|nr:MAG: tungstate ABC transporter substrate-binding protein WtpA [Ignavibacteriae bacterium HGW-Ignavibacteriae-3]
MKYFSLFKLFIVSCFMMNSIKAQNPNQLTVFHAGSLTVPFEKIIQGFKKENPGVEVLKEIAGSRECARKISELKKPCDVFASADYLIIDQLLIPEFADWNLKFASNEMAIVYTDKSRRSKEINGKNWFSILMDKNIVIGRADPNSDPCGYRAILTMKLSEIFYNEKGLTEKLLSKDNEYIRPKEVDLLALLETGELDYIFLYRSVAEQHGLKFLILPDEVNLKKAELENYYNKVSVELNGKRPGERISQYGSSMVYGVTIPKNSPNPLLAKKFVHYLMSEEKGLRVMREMGQPTVVPSFCDNYVKLPDDLKIYSLKK